MRNPRGFNRPAGLARLAPLLLGVALLGPLAGFANELNGRISVRAEGAEVLPAAGTDPVPLKDVTVILGVLERNPMWDPLAIFAKVAITKTNDNGEYSFFLGPDPAPGDPVSEIDHALIVILESSGVITFDHEAAANDAPDKPACLASAAFKVPTAGVHQADLDLLADGGGNAEVSSSYSFKNAGFEPLLDLDTGILLGERPDCDEVVFDGFSARYDVRGFANVQPERFAHHAIMHVRAHDAFEFARDGLTAPAPVAVELQTWFNFAGFDAEGMAYDCDFSRIMIDPSFSDFFGPRGDSHLFSMRHEYGHHFVCGSQIGGGSQEIAIPAGDQPHGGLFNQTSAASWSEGFASYFAAAVAEYKAEAQPNLLVTPAGKFDLLDDLITIDNPVQSGEQREFGISSEELSIASLLWRVSTLTGADTLVARLESAGSSLTDFAAVYSTLSGDPTINSKFPSQCSFNDSTDSVAAGIDCLFIERGFYHDANGDGLYTDAAEFVGANTRWTLIGPSARLNTDFRPNFPAIEGSLLRLSAIDTGGQPVSLDRFDIQIEYDSPYEFANFDHVEKAFGDSPYEFPIMIPARPSEAVITAIKDGQAFGAPLTIQSGFYHQKINPFSGDPVEPILLEHVFTESGEPPKPPLIFEDGFEAVPVQ